MRKYLLLLLAVLFCAGLQAQTTIYVSSVVTDDSGDGSSWEHAKKYIASAITALNGNPGTVFVMAGEYNTTSELQIPTGVTVDGRFQPELHRHGHGHAQSAGGEHALAG